MRRWRWIGATGLYACASCTFGADEYRFVDANRAGAAGRLGAGSAGAPEAAGQGGAGAGQSAAGGGAPTVCQPSERACDGKHELTCSADRTKLEPSRDCGPSGACEPGKGCVTPLEVVAGVDTTCARYSDGSARCWGRNDHGQLGVGALGGKRPVPSEVVGADGATRLAGVTSVAVGWRSACALTAGEVWCWGSDDNGQLGDGPGQTSDTPRPVKVAMPVKAKQVAGALLTFCAVGVDEQVWCWGSNTNRLLGSGMYLSEAPVVAAAAVQVGPSPLSISVGAAAACVLAGGNARCWGLNLRGEAGVGKTDSIAHGPDLVRWAPGDPPIPSVVRLSIGGVSLNGNNPYSHLLLATGDGAANGALACWGWNEHGQCLVDPTSPAVTTPQPVPAISPIQVAAGGQHSCAAFSATPTTPNVQCWGWNEHGQIGNGAKTPSAVKSPFTVPGPVRAVVSAGARHTCALGGAQADTIWCWGDGADGQLGDGGFDAQPSPRVVTSP